MSEIESSSNLTSGQFRIWAGQKLDPKCPLYNMALAFRLKGDLQYQPFRDAFQTLVNQSDALRTVISESDGIPQQITSDKIVSPLAFEDLSDQTSPLDKAHSLAKERSTRIFDLNKGLFDSVLFKIADDDYIWYLNQHHLITDGWSCAILFRRMAEYYQLALHKTLHSVPKLPQYNDYRRYEHEFKETKSYTSSSAYWKEKQSGTDASIELYGHAPSQTATASERYFCDIGHERSEALHALAKDSDFRSFSIDLSLFNIFSALLFAYLFRISGNTKLSIGTLSHHRPTATFKETIGLFIELFPLDVSIPPKSTFRTLIKSVAPASLDFLKNALPGSAGNQSGNAYAAVLNYINASFSDFNDIPIESTWIHPGHVDRGHALRLQVQDFDNSGRIQLHFDLSRDIFDHDMAQKAIEHFLKLMDALIVDPDQMIETVDLISENETSAIANTNATRVERPGDATIVSLLQQQTTATLKATAVVENNQVTTYQGLDQKSDVMARYLRKSGVVRGTLVAVYLERSTDMVAALIGILKAGAAFVPIDASFPIQRIAYILKDCKAPIVLTQRNLQNRISAGDLAAVCVDDVWQTPMEDTETDIGFFPTEEDLAYVIYTSGSTGRPKGVMIPHRALANYLLWARNHYMHDGPHDFPLFSTVAADLTITSIFLPLISGSAIRVYPENSDGLDLSIMDVFREDAVDIVKLTPSHLSMLTKWQLKPNRIKKLIVGGEDFKTGLAQRIYGFFDGNVEIYNEYGPTEATVGCMIYRFDPTKDGGRSVSIGNPIDNTRIYLLDAGLNPVPMGVKGDIFIAGQGLARGYLNQAALASAAFVADPFQPGELMYNSGDIGRRDSAGLMNFLGRKDDQVKVRGFRIELGEIESTLLEAPGIQETVARVEDYQSARSNDDVDHCRICGLSSNHPKAKLDNHHICRICRKFEQLKDTAHLYFKTEADLAKILDHAKSIREGPYNCLMQFSGGKDSTYALYQLVEMGMHPLVFSFDNGFISEGAKENIQRVVDHLKLDLVWGKTPAMNSIFVDSLRRFSNVCNGCQKVINTLSVNLAKERGIRYIFTGLSRGQFFETRVSELFSNQIFDSKEIDGNIIEARKAYHRMKDAVSEHLDVSAFKDDAVFEEIEFVDFYRYTNVELQDILSFLDRRAPWIRPADTGRSTNCLINEAGIYIHKKERGFHNYELPYSWDVRLGHKDRDSALEELDDDIDTARVTRMLKTIGYNPEEKNFSVSDRRIVAYYVADEEYTSDVLRERLSQTLPNYMIPAHFLRIKAIPLNATGKIDRDALPIPGKDRAGLPSAYVAPRSDVEQLLANIWSRVMGADEVGIHDNFFDLGGDSILSIQIAAQADKYGLKFAPGLLLQYATVADLAANMQESAIAGDEQGVIHGAVPLPPMKNVEDIYPLSPLQEGMLFHSLKESSSGAYHEQYYCRLNGDFDPLVYRQAWQSVVNRHTILRTAFLWEELDQPVQVVRGRVELDWIEQDLEDVSKQNYNDWLQSYLSDDRSHPFDLSKAPLMRFRLFRMDSNTYQWIWSYHHILSDGWSTAIILKEVNQAYNNLRNGSRAQYPAAPKPYRDFIAWLQSRSLDGARQYWKERFKGFTKPTPIPLPRPAHTIGGYQQIEGSLQRSMSADLERIAKSQRLTLNTVIQGAWTILLYRYAGERDIVFGSTVSGRPATMDGFTDMVGLFINTLPVRVMVDPQMRLSQWLASLQASEIEARNFEHSPLSKVQAWSGLPPGAQLFDTIVVFENYPRQNADNPPTSGDDPPTSGDDQPTSRDDQPTSRDDQPTSGIEFSHVNYKAHSNYPLALIVIPEQEELRLILIYDRSRFKETDIQRLFGHYNAILQSFIDRPHRLIKDVSVMPDNEKQTVSQWQIGTIREEKHPLVYLQWEAQAALQPTAPAVTCREQTLSYDSLNGQANQLAQLLIECPQDLGTRIGIYLYRSIDMITAIIAILKSGAAYVPLDPSYPTKRISHMIVDSGITHILTTRQLVKELPATATADIIILEEELDLKRSPRQDKPDRLINPEDLAYIIYTSGSTGMPKGAKINHANLAHSTGARQNYYPHKPKRFLLLSSISFDSSIAGIFHTLCQGGNLIIPDQKHHRDIDYLTALIEEKQITHMLSIPSLYQHMLLFYAARVTSLQAVIVAGEPCPAGLTTHHFSALPQTELFNEYGPTEGTVWSTVYRCRPNDPPGPIPIGRPIENTQIRILDGDLQSTPPGIPGEIYIGGSGIFQGYINHYDTPSAQFIYLSDNQKNAKRFYKSGDLAYFREDGNIIYSGRVDQQVKLRGYRIELGEIETIIAEHPDVIETAVILDHHNHQKERLVAYVGTLSNKAELIPALQDFLNLALPEYMIPSIIIAMDQLPRTMNDKIDRHALPSPDESNRTNEDTYVAPRNALEEGLSTIWSDILGVEKVGIKDNFFELGGDSLSAIRLISSIKNKAKCRIPINVLFNAPTIEQLSDYVNFERIPRSNSSIVPLQPRGHKIPLFLTFNSRFGLQRFLEDDQPHYKLLTYYDEVPLPKKMVSIESIAEKYIKDIKEDFETGPYILCGYSAGGMIMTEMANQLRDRHNESVFLFLLEPTWPRNVELKTKYAPPPKKPIMEKVVKHLSAMRDNPFRAIVTIAEKIKMKVVRRLEPYCQYPLYRICTLFGFQFPLSWRYQYAVKIYKQSAAKYKAKPYDGPATICLTNASVTVDPADWSKIYQNINDIHMLPEAKDHQDFIHNEVIVKQWVQYLNRLLKKINKVY